MRPGYIVAAALALSACLDPLEPDVGALLRSPCSDEDSDPGLVVSFRSDIVEGIFRDPEIACLNCHAPDAPTPLGFEVGGLDLRTHAALRAGGAVSGGDIVIAAQPCASLLLQKVAQGPPFGARMPLDGPPFLSVEQQLTIHDWIAEGALDN